MVFKHILLLVQFGINLTRIIHIRLLFSQRPFLWLCHSMFVQFDRTGRRRLKPYVILFNTESIQFPANYSVNCSPQQPTTKHQAEQHHTAANYNTPRTSAKFIMYTTKAWAKTSKDSDFEVRDVLRTTIYFLKLWLEKQKKLSISRFYPYIISNLPPFSTISTL